MTMSTRSKQQVVHALRAAARVLEAKTAGHFKSFTEAVDAFEAGGSVEDMLAALDRHFLSLFVSADGIKGEGMFGQRTSSAPWLLALSTMKANKLRLANVRADTEMHHLRNFQKMQGDAKRYAEYGEGERQMRVNGLRALEPFVKVVDGLAAHEDASFQHGPFTIKVLPGVTKKAMNTALAALDKVTAALKTKFPQVLYGTIYMSTKVGGHWTAAQYSVKDDVIYLSPKHISLGDNDEGAIAHEFGHRYDHKFIDKDLRKQFTDLSLYGERKLLVFDEDLRKKVAEEVLTIVKMRNLGIKVPGSEEVSAWLHTPGMSSVAQKVTAFGAGRLSEEEFRAFLVGTKDATVDLGMKATNAVTPYGATSPSENFAEAFSFYALGKEFPEPLRLLLEQMR